MLDDDIMSMFRSAMEEDQAERYRKMSDRPGWIFREVPMIPRHLFAEFIEVVGVTEMYWLRRTEMTFNGTSVTLGAAMFSPTAVANVQKWMEENPHRKTL